MSVIGLCLRCRFADLLLRDALRISSFLDAVLSSIKGSNEKVLKDHGEERIMASITKYYHNVSGEYFSLNDPIVKAAKNRKKREGRRSSRVKKVSTVAPNLHLLEAYHRS